MAVLLAVAIVAVFTSIRGPSIPKAIAPPPNKESLPQPIPQPITRTSAGAPVAWLWVASQSQSNLVAIGRDGKQVARFDQSTAPGFAATYGVWRSADGSTIFTVGSGQITAYSALDGTVQRAYGLAPGNVVGDAFSPDGHWLALLLLGTGLQLQLIDLRTGSSQLVAVGHDPNASLPGMNCSGGCAGTVAWGLAIFAPSSNRLYTLTDGADLHVFPH